eukprot:364766-Chlamydomonas_euryale.AAC.4
MDACQFDRQSTCSACCEHGLTQDMPRAGHASRGACFTHGMHLLSHDEVEPSPVVCLYLTAFDETPTCMFLIHE